MLIVTSIIRYAAAVEHHETLAENSFKRSNLLGIRGLIPKGKICYMLMCFCLFFLFFASNELYGAPYYEGKSISIIVGYGPGGGYDRMARLIARHLPKYIPGKPTVIVQNMPGADSMIAANHVYNISKPDGLTIGAFERGMPFAQLQKAQGVRFDLSKFSWIGSEAIETRALALRADLPYKTFDDLVKLKSPLMIGYTGPAESTGQFCVLLRDFLGVNLKMVTYISRADVMLAMERKELDGTGTSYNSIKPYLDRNLARLFIRGRSFEPGMENLPIDEDMTTNLRGKAIMSIFSATDRMGRPFVAPPKTPPAMVSILRSAFLNVAKDQQLKEDSKRLMMTVEYVPAAECLRVVNNILNQPEDILKEIVKYVKY